MESQLTAGQRAKCSDSCKSKSDLNTSENNQKPIFKIASGLVKGEVSVDSSTISKDNNNTNSQEDQSRLRAVKAVVYKIVRVYEARPPNTMKYLGIATILLLFVGIIAIALAQENSNDSTQSKYGMAFTLGETAAQSASSEKIVAPPPAIIENKVSDSTQTEANATTEEEQVVTTLLPKIEDSNVEINKTDEKTDTANENDRPSMVIENEDEEKNDEEQQPNPRIVFIERLMGLHLSAPANKAEVQVGEQKEQANEQQQNVVKNDKVNAKWAERTRKFTIPIPNQAGLQRPPFMPPPMPQENPILRSVAAAMMSRLVAAAARAQMEAQAREAELARNSEREDEVEENSIPLLVARIKAQQQQQDRIPMQSMYGRPIIRQQMMQHYQPQRPIERAFVAPIQQRVNFLQRRIAPQPQPVVVMLAVPLRNAESQQSQIIHQQPQVHQMPHYPSVPYTVPVIYRQQAPAATVHVPIQTVHVPQYMTYQQQPRQMMSYNQVRPVVEVPVEHQVQHQIVAIRPHMQHQHDHQPSSSEPGHMILLYNAEVQNDENDDLEPSATEEREEAMRRAQKINHFLAHHLPPNPTPAKVKLFRELFNTKQAVQQGVRYIPVSFASNDYQNQKPVNHFVNRVQTPEESAPHQSILLFAHNQPDQ